MATVLELLGSAERVLASGGIPDPRREAASLLSFALGKDRTFLIAHPEHVVADDAIAWFLDAVRRRSSREPFHYITGTKEFYGASFVITPDVLIPRPETELLVEQAISLIGHLERPLFCEVGVGSGCISASILSSVAAAKGVGLDVSEKAIEVATLNLERLGVLARIELRQSDVFRAMRSDERFDLIVSNPPYVPASEIPHLQPEVRDHEPLSALTDGANGLSIIEKLISGSPGYLFPGGAIAFEIGFGQAANVLEMLTPDLWDAVTAVPDLQGIERVVIARKRKDREL